MDLASVPLAIREAGFVPAELAIVASGRFEDDGRTFRPEGWTRVLTVESGSAETDGPARITASVTGWEEGRALALVATTVERP